MAKFQITGGKGFQMEFENGYRISVQFGPYNYCEKRDKSRPETDSEVWESGDAEVAVIGPNGDWATREAWQAIFGTGLTDDVSGWVSPDGVAKMVAWASQQ